MANRQEEKFIEMKGGISIEESTKRIKKKFKEKGFSV